jgi:4-amino-4-deoxy-L-arabinose transferase-like glycosyltransferase
MPLSAATPDSPGRFRIWLYAILWTAWIVPGLIGHDPWKPDEAYIFGVVNHMLKSGDWIVPVLAGEPFLDHPPFYYLVAASVAKLFSRWMQPHDAARLASGGFMGLTLLFLAFAARELYGRSYGWIAAMALVGCVGLLVRAHQIITDVAMLAGLAAALNGLALASRRSVLAGIWLGSGAGMAFLSNGWTPLFIVLITGLALPVFFAAWRNRRVALALLFALLALAPWVAIWPYLLYARSPALFNLWLWPSLAQSFATLPARVAEYGYYFGILPWYAWPVLPMALWTLWREGRQRLSNPAIQLPLTSFLASLVVLSVAQEVRELRALPLLLPLSLLASASVDSLRRGAAAALDWFGIMTFGVFAVLMWVGWVALLTGSPEIIAAELARIQPQSTTRFSAGAFALSLVASLLWLALVWRIGRSNRRALINWAAGITLVWILAMTLWLPFIETTKSYRSMIASLKQALPDSHGCIASRGLGESQRALLEYFAGIVTEREERTPVAKCELFLFQGRTPQTPLLPPGQWRQIWEGSRPGDKDERYRLYQRL